MNIKIGDKVKCCGTNYGVMECGSGFSPGLVFTVTSITIGRSGRKIYFGAVNGNGVFDDYVTPYIEEVQGDSKLTFKFIR